MAPAPDPDAQAPADVDAVRAEFAGYVRAYRDVVAAASKASGASLVRVDGAFAAFEPGYFNNLLVALEARFAPGEQAVGGPVRREVRAICAALIQRGGRMGADAPAGSVLRLDAGDRVALNADDFEEIAAALFDEAAKRAQ